MCGCCGIVKDALLLDGLLALVPEDGMRSLLMQEWNVTIYRLCHGSMSFHAVADVLQSSLAAALLCNEAGMTLVHQKGFIEYLMNLTLRPTVLIVILPMQHTVTPVATSAQLIQLMLTSS